MKPDIARDISYSRMARTRRGRLVVKTLETLSGRHSLLRRAAGYDAAISEGAIFWEEMARRYGLRCDFLRGGIDTIPASGPVVVVANHPYGILDGLILSLLLSRRRPGGFRVIANDVFMRTPDLGEVILPISFEQDRAAQAMNLATRQTALSWLRDGGLLGVFPGGTVSTPLRPFGAARDPGWRGFSAKLIRQSGATVVPVHFEGENSRLFHLASHLHITLRVGLLLREFRARTDRPVRLSVGDALTPADIASIPGDQRDLMAALRARTYAAGGQDDRPGFDFDRRKEGCA